MPLLSCLCSFFFFFFLLCFLCCLYAFIENILEDSRDPCGLMGNWIHRAGLFMSSIWDSWCWQLIKTQCHDQKIYRDLGLSVRPGPETNSRVWHVCASTQQPILISLTWTEVGLCVFSTKAADCVRSASVSTHDQFHFHLNHCSDSTGEVVILTLRMLMKVKLKIAVEKR